MTPIDVALHRRARRDFLAGVVQDILHDADQRVPPFLTAKEQRQVARIFTEMSALAAGPGMSIWV